MRQAPVGCRSRGGSHALAATAAALLLAGCNGSATPNGARSPVWAAPLSELADPWGPARLYDNRLTILTSADPMTAGTAPILPNGNQDFGVFERDCRRELGETPIALRVREPQATCPPGVDGLVLAHGDGAGVVSRVWLTALDVLTMAQWQDEELRLYRDGATIPTFRLRYADLAAGAAPFTAPAAGVRSGSLVNYWPWRFTNGFWLTLARPRAKLYYHQVDIVRGALPAADAAPAVAATAIVRDGRSGQAAMTVAGEGAGGWLEIALRGDAAAAERLRQATLEFAFDGVTSSAAVADLCLAGARFVTWSSPRIDVDVADAGGVTCTMRWGWPFGANGAVTLRAGDTAGISLSVVPAAAAPEPLPAGRFFVQSATHTAAVPARMRWAGVAGDGRLVALLLFGTGAPDDAFPVGDPHNFLEGDETLWVDGAVVARGTGTEDLFNGGFYFRDGDYAGPWGGVADVAVDGAGWGRAHMARYFLGADQVRFHTELRGEIEIGADHPQLPHRYRSAAIVYLRP